MEVIGDIVSRTLTPVLNHSSRLVDCFCCSTFQRADWNSSVFHARTQDVPVCPEHTPAQERGHLGAAQHVPSSTSAFLRTNHSGRTSSRGADRWEQPRAQCTFHEALDAVLFMLDSSALWLDRAEQCFHGIAMECRSTSGAQRPRSVHQRLPFMTVFSRFCGGTFGNHSVETLHLKIGGQRGGGTRGN